LQEHGAVTKQPAEECDDRNDACKRDVESDQDDDDEDDDDVRNDTQFEQLGKNTPSESAIICSFEGARNVLGITAGPMKPILMSSTSNRSNELLSYTSTAEQRIFSKNMPLKYKLIDIASLNANMPRQSINSDVESSSYRVTNPGYDRLISDQTKLSVFATNFSRDRSTQDRILLQSNIINDAVNQRRFPFSLSLPSSLSNAALAISRPYEPSPVINIPYLDQSRVLTSFSVGQSQLSSSRVEPEPTKSRCLVQEQSNSSVKSDSSVNSDQLGRSPNCSILQLQDGSVFWMEKLDNGQAILRPIEELSSAGLSSAMTLQSQASMHSSSTPGFGEIAISSSLDRDRSCIGERVFSAAGERVLTAASMMQLVNRKSDNMSVSNLRNISLIQTNAQSEINLSRLPTENVQLQAPITKVVGIGIPNVGSSLSMDEDVLKSERKRTSVLPRHRPFTYSQSLNEMGHGTHLTAAVSRSLTLPGPTFLLESRVRSPTSKPLPLDTREALEHRISLLISQNAKIIDTPMADPPRSKRMQRRNSEASDVLDSGTPNRALKSHLQRTASLTPGNGSGASPVKAVENVQSMNVADSKLGIKQLLRTKSLTQRIEMAESVSNVNLCRNDAVIVTKAALASYLHSTTMSQISSKVGSIPTLLISNDGIAITKLIESQPCRMNTMHSLCVPAEAHGTRRTLIHAHSNPETTRGYLVGSSASIPVRQHSGGGVLKPEHLRHSFSIPAAPQIALHPPVVTYSLRMPSPRIVIPDYLSANSTSISKLPIFCSQVSINHRPEEGLLLQTKNLATILSPQPHVKVNSFTSVSGFDNKLSKSYSSSPPQSIPVLESAQVIRVPVLLQAVLSDPSNAMSEPLLRLLERNSIKQRQYASLPQSLSADVYNSKKPPKLALIQQSAAVKSMTSIERPMSSYTIERINPRLCADKQASSSEKKIKINVEMGASMSSNNAQNLVSSPSSLLSKIAPAAPNLFQSLNVSDSPLTAVCKLSDSVSFRHFKGASKAVDSLPFATSTHSIHMTPCMGLQPSQWMPLIFRNQSLSTNSSEFACIKLSTPSICSINFDTIQTNQSTSNANSSVFPTMPTIAIRHQTPYITALPSQIKKIEKVTPFIPDNRIILRTTAETDIHKTLNTSTSDIATSKFSITFEMVNPQQPAKRGRPKGSKNHQKLPISSQTTAINDISDKSLVPLKDKQQSINTTSNAVLDRLVVIGNVNVSSNVNLESTATSVSLENVGAVQSIQGGDSRMESNIVMRLSDPCYILKPSQVASTFNTDSDINFTSSSSAGLSWKLKLKDRLLMKRSRSTIERAPSCDEVEHEQRVVTHIPGVVHSTTKPTEAATVLLSGDLGLFQRSQSYDAAMPLKKRRKLTELGRGTAFGTHVEDGNNDVSTAKLGEDEISAEHHELLKSHYVSTLVTAEECCQPISQGSLLSNSTLKSEDLQFKSRPIGASDITLFIATNRNIQSATYAPAALSFMVRGSGKPPLTLSVPLNIAGNIPGLVPLSARERSSSWVDDQKGLSCLAVDESDVVINKCAPVLETPVPVGIL